MMPLAPDSAPPPLPTSRKLNLWLFFGVMAAPVILTLLTVRFISQGGDAAPVVALLGGGGAGIGCGAMLGWRLGNTTGARIALGVLFAVIFAVVCVVLCCVGCLAGAYQLNFH
jgi:hypothetical protein